jgi:hypothetical protein
MFEQDVLFLARLVSNGLSDGPRHWDLSQVSPSFQSVAVRLLGAHTEERRSIWDDFLANRTSAQSLSQAALATRTPDGPQPHELTAPCSPGASPAGPVRIAARTDRRAKLTCAANVEPRAVEWLWYGRVPIGMLTMFAGDPKLGKSYVTLSMAAALSRVLPMPMSGIPERTGSTILMSAEDDPNHTIVPRLIAAGADLAKIHMLDSVILANGSEAFPSLRADIDAITAVAARLGDCRLIVIDPVSAYLKGVDDNRNAVVRGVLTPLKKLAEQLRAAVILISHLTKGGSANAKHRVLGSIAYVGACRANHLFVNDPRDPTGRRVLMIDNGGNLAARAPTLAYTIEESSHGPRVQWADEPLTITVEEALRRPQKTPPRGPTEAHECSDWLRDFLQGQPKPASDVFTAARDAGYTRDQIKDAKRRIGAAARKYGFQEGARWTWELSMDALDGPSEGNGCK